MKRRTAVVEGPLAFRMRRSAAARNRELGLEILTLPQLAARLAGGFSRLAEREVLFSAINAALAKDGYCELESVRRLPGMARAVARTFTSRDWPRLETEDPLLPSRILERRRWEPISIADRDRRAFNLLIGQTTQQIVLSRSRRNAEGHLQWPSPLWPDDVKTEIRGRTRIPTHFVWHSLPISSLISTVNALHLGKPVGSFHRSGSCHDAGRRTSPLSRTHRL